MGDDSKKLDKYKTDLERFRTRPNQRPLPSPRTQTGPHASPHANLPDVDMRPKPGASGDGSKGWQERYAARTGAGYLQAEHTATLPNPLVWNWPIALRDALYEFCWAKDWSEGALSQLLGKLGDYDVRKLVAELDKFKIEDLSEEGAAIYLGLVADLDRRDGTRSRVGEDVHRVRIKDVKSHDEHEEHEEHVVEEKKRLQR